jgi:hypothetical protein
MLLISADESGQQAAEYDLGDSPDFDVVRAWLADLQQRGVLQVHEGLHPSRTATTVRVRGDEVLLSDGPFAEAKDQVGGFAVIECDDLDEAIEVAAGHPAARFGQVEIRPVREP